MYGQQLSQGLSVVATIDPDANTADTYSSDVVDMCYHRRVAFIVMVGTMASTSVLDCKLQSSPNNSDWTDISGKAITQFTEAGTDSDKQAIIEISAEELRALGARYVKAVMTVGTAASDSALVAIAGYSRFSPASEYDLASVDEIVA